LRHEERIHRAAAERAVNIAELNHNVRNAIFPLFLAVQRSREPEADRLAQEAMARLDIALRDATVDAYSGRIRYAEESFDKAVAA
jgi:Zn-dependent protease with chaperone function